MGDHADALAVHVHDHVGDVFRGQVELAAPARFLRPGREQEGRFRLDRTIEVELDGVGVEPGAAVVVTLTAEQLPAPAYRKNIVLPTDRRFDTHGQLTAVVELFQGLQALLADVHVFTGGDTARTLEMHTVAVGAAQHADRGRRHGGVDHRVGAVDHQPGRLAAEFVTLQVAVARVTGVAVDSGQLQGLGVDHHGAPHAVEQGYRAVRHDAVEPGAPRGQAGFAEGVAHPILAVDPTVAGVGIGVRQDRFAQLLGGRVFDAHVQIVRITWGKGQVRVGVHVVQARHAEGALQIVLDRMRARAGLEFGQVADTDEFTAANRHGLGPGLRRILGVDTPIAQDQVSELPGGRVGRGKVVSLSHGATFEFRTIERVQRLG
ncbi:hypothetical protein D9M71_106960 [compost metagenome]